jgi:hypothetical protein
MRKRIHRSIRTFAALILLASLITVSTASVARADEVGFNDSYVFAATKALERSDTSPLVKVPLFPVTIVLDVAVLPFTVIAGFVS